MKDTVLVVNENVNARIIVQTLLQSRGIPVAVAEDAVAALEIVERNRSVAILLLDLDEMSPGMSGWELLRSLRRRYGGPARSDSPRVVVQSERRDHETESFVRHLGAEAFLRKPTAPSDLLHAIGTMLTPEPAMPRLRVAGRIR